MAYLVKTTGKFGLFDPATREDVGATRPGILHRADFINLVISRKQVIILANDLPEEVTDKEFASYWNESAGTKDQEALAVASFLSKYQEAEAEGEGEPEAEAEAEAEAEQPKSKKNSKKK